MKVYFGTKGNSYYIMAMGVTVKFIEVYCFDMFGNLVNTNGSISICNNWREVEYISIAGEGNTCEILSNSAKGNLSCMVLNCVASLRKEGGYIGTMFNVNHEDSSGKFNQVIFLYEKGRPVKDILCKNFPSLVLR